MADCTVTFIEQSGPIKLFLILMSYRPDSFSHMLSHSSGHMDIEHNLVEDAVHNS